MRFRAYRCLLPLLNLLFMLGCESEVSPPALADPCDIALSPHQGEGPLDQEIIALQAQARKAADPVPYLERLGWAYIAKGRAALDAGYYKLAEQCALCLESKKPLSHEAMLLRGHILHSTHHFKEAESFARQLAAERGLSFDFGLLGDALMEQGKLDEAIGAYQQMMDQKPSPQAYSRAAHVRWLKGDLPGAIELLDMAAGASGSRDSEAAAWIWVRLALYSMQAGQIEKGAASIQAALELLPGYPPALLVRGRLLLAQGKAAEALESLQRAAQGNPLPEYLWLLTDVLRLAGRTEDAAAVETKLAKSGAADDPRTFSLYLATRGLDRPWSLRLAEEELKSRADVFTHDALAWALRGSGKLAEASAASQRALRENTQDARLYLHAGIIAADSGQLKEARRCLDLARASRRMLFPSEQDWLDQYLNHLNGILNPQ